MKAHILRLHAKTILIDCNISFFVTEPGTLIFQLYKLAFFVQPQTFADITKLVLRDCDIAN